MDCEEMLNFSILAVVRIMEEGIRYIVNGFRDIYLYKFIFFYFFDWKIVYVYYFDNDNIYMYVIVGNFCVYLYNGNF